MPKRWKTLAQAIARLNELEAAMLEAQRNVVARAIEQGEILHGIKDANLVADWADAARRIKRGQTWVKVRERLYRLRRLIAKSELQYAKNAGLDPDQLPLHGVFRRLTLYRHPDRLGRPGTTDLQLMASNANLPLRSQTKAAAASLLRNSSEIAISLQGGELYPAPWEEVIPKLADHCLDCAFLDSPYYPRARDEEKDWAQDIDVLLTYHVNLLSQLKPKLKPRASVFAFGNLHNIGAINVAMKRTGLRLINEIVWYRLGNPPSKGYNLQHRHENILWACSGGHPRWNFQDVRDANYPNDPFRRSRTDGRTANIQLGDVWAIEDFADLIAVPAERIKNAATVGVPMKPLALIFRLLDMVQIDHGLVLDPFGGSGNIVLACQKRGLKFIVCERDLGRAALIQKRLGLALEQDAAD